MKDFDVRLPTTALGWFQFVLIALVVAMAFTLGPSAAYQAVIDAAPFYAA